MSSHHIVRENQEPALIVSSYKAIDVEYFGQLLEWSPTIITDKNTIDFLLTENVKIDVVFGNEEEPYPQEQIKFLPLKKGFLSDALDYLVQCQYKAVNIVCEKIDEMLEAYCSLINVVVLSGNKRYVYVRNRYEKWKEAGATIDVAESKLKSLVGIKKIAPDKFTVEQDGFIYLEFNTDEYVRIDEEI